MNPIDAKKPTLNTASPSDAATAGAWNYPALAKMSPSFVVEIVVTHSG